MTYENFTDRARYVVQLAKGAARECQQHFVEPVDLLAGLLKESSGVAQCALRNCGIVWAAYKPVYEKMRMNSFAEPCASDGSVLSGETQRIFELARDEAKELAHGTIGTEHLLLGLLNLPLGHAVHSVLHDFQATAALVRVETLRLLDKPSVMLTAETAQLATDVSRLILAEIVCDAERYRRLRAQLRVTTHNPPMGSPPPWFLEALVPLTIVSETPPSVDAVADSLPEQSGGLGAMLAQLLKASNTELSA